MFAMSYLWVLKSRISLRISNARSKRSFISLHALRRVATSSVSRINSEMVDSLMVDNAVSDSDENCNDQSDKQSEKRMHFKNESRKGVSQSVS